jgi:hypothetical protein
MVASFSFAITSLLKHCSTETLETGWFQQRLTWASYWIHRPVRYDERWRERKRKLLTTSSSSQLSSQSESSEAGGFLKTISSRWDRNMNHDTTQSSTHSPWGFPSAFFPFTMLEIFDSLSSQSNSILLNHLLIDFYRRWTDLQLEILQTRHLLYKKNFYRAYFWWLIDLL